ncbi:uncharacterized protein SCHCODRAFT_01201857 [Schizophyllum commune H4-8]|uniref:uncharacterized protein n=1 Tax=Schizophyllum commune (strain H4-8 / FGSC 9210) TaxID=578458 RepID=UPI002160671D|nr:uncharacterized protein SCHCODRAFT_01201857 [Schizophyllum commune H4-8]KAI5891414.1 hypothetical protein SCHCODRAFT_01201857 [Schizophyllum commune H4-8]
MTAYDLALSSGAAIGAYICAGAAPMYIAISFIVLLISVFAALRTRRARAAAEAAQLARTVELERQAASLARALDSAQNALHASQKERDFARVVRLVDEMRVACLQRRADRVEQRNAELEARVAAVKQEFIELEERSAELVRQHTTAEHEKGKLGEEAKRLSKALDAYESLFFGDAGEEMELMERRPRSCVETMCPVVPLLKRPSIELLAPASHAPLENVIATPSDEHDDDMTLTAPSTCGSHMSFAPPSPSSLKACTSSPSRPLSPSKIPRLQPPRAKSDLSTASAPAMKPERTSSRGRILFSTSPGRLSSMVSRKARICEDSTASTGDLKKRKSVPATQKRIWRF